ncbi:hypothetical protein AAFF_G00267240 [Aldrovandia affinis]|uniref:Uncharacterized protein n=1 Tax=Aldrovandia affinis TaxID=143900 RepID=A0AAD7W282_9TELE|nr:hypothetical protein AAFF_G00267240 [Aldrovandia affinis]
MNKTLFCAVFILIVLLFVANEGAGGGQANEGADAKKANEGAAGGQGKSSASTVTIPFLLHLGMTLLPALLL